MTTRMLIDARHREETRVAVLKGNRIEEFDFESAEHKQIKGNIYLAKVTRVEPSLQAAFVDFGGNRHGFLAFSEIHPDYYQIPKEDREALLAEEAAHAEEEAALRAAEDDDDDDYGDGDYAEGDYAGGQSAGDDDFGGHGYDDEAGYGHGEGVTEVDTSEKNEVATIEGGVVETRYGDDEADHGDDADDGDAEARESEADGETDGAGEANGSDRRNHRKGRRQGRAQSKEAEDLRARRMALRRRYKIQDVIQRRQVLLVQVVKEERGNKGAALTTYLSLAGRYCVLMPNSSHGGGISRKISSSADRKRLKAIIGELGLPNSMSCIVRTAGLQRTKTEIKRDFDYLARLWDEIRDNTLKAVAPALIHSDSDLVKRAIRDIYNREIEEIIVEGDDGYRAAKDFMKLLMPSHARRVKHYADPVPLFQRYGAEDQLSAMYDPVVQLRSGGYLVINPTEALVSIDINSGRSTKEHGIEATAVSTNLEAAREIARQLRLRDMAGLVVIDFIDMEYGSNIRKVEKAMKDALKDDRARIQVGRISGFGLMEMSRQRLRTGVLEATTRACPHCDGTGLVRTASSAGLTALRMIEEEAAKGKGTVISLYASQEASIYVLNAKRVDLAEIEARYGVNVEVIPEGENEGAKMRVVSRGPKPEFVPRFTPIIEPLEDDLDDEIEDDVDDGEAEAAPRRDGSRREGGQREASRRDSTGRDDKPREGGQRESTARDDGARDDGEGEGGRRKRRKRRRGRGRDRRDDDTPLIEGTEADDANSDIDGDDQAGDELEASEAAEAGYAHDDDQRGDGSERNTRKRRRRGRRRRGGQRDGDSTEFGGDTAGEEGEGDSQGDGEIVAEAADAADLTSVPEAAHSVAVAEAPAADAPAAEPAPVKPRRTRRKAVAAEAVPTEAEDVAATPAVDATDAAEPAPTKPKRTRRKAAADATPVADAATAPTADATTATTEAATEDAAAEPAAKPKRTRRKAAAPLAGAAAPAAAGIVADPAASASEPVADAPAATDGDDLAEDAAGEAGDGGTPRRGWWQRTFGA